MVTINRDRVCVGRMRNFLLAFPLHQLCPLGASLQTRSSWSSLYAIHSLVKVLSAPSSQISRHKLVADAPVRVLLVESN